MALKGDLALFNILSFWLLLPYLILSIVQATKPVDNIKDVIIDLSDYAEDDIFSPYKDQDDIYNPYKYKDEYDIFSPYKDQDIFEPYKEENRISKFFKNKDEYDIFSSPKDFTYSDSNSPFTEPEATQTPNFSLPKANPSPVSLQVPSGSSTLAWSPHMRHMLHFNTITVSGIDAHYTEDRYLVKFNIPRHEKPLGTPEPENHEIVLGPLGLEMDGKPQIYVIPDQNSSDVYYLETGDIYPLVALYYSNKNKQLEPLYRGKIRFYQDDKLVLIKTPWHRSFTIPESKLKVVSSETRRDESLPSLLNLSVSSEEASVDLDKVANYIILNFVFQSDN